jgi:hypothetical protein
MQIKAKRRLAALFRLRRTRAPVSGYVGISADFDGKQASRRGRNAMGYVRAAAVGLLFVVALCLDMTAPKSGPKITIASTAFAQAQNETVTSRVKRWTRARLEAAKKHWANDQQWFSECTSELNELKKKSKRRLSYHRQGHFLEQCMRDKHSRS